MFKFTIRELLLLTVIVALTVAWGLQQRAWIEKYSAKSSESERWQARAEVLAERWRTEGGTVEWKDDALFTWRFGSGGVQVTRTSPSTTP